MSTKLIWQGSRPKPQINTQTGSNPHDLIVSHLCINRKQKTHSDPPFSEYFLLISYVYVLKKKERKKKSNNQLSSCSMMRKYEYIKVCEKAN